MKKDSLYELFIKRLHNLDSIEESTTEFVQRLAKEFFMRLTDDGHVPQPHRTILLDDIEDEIIEMYRKKTYGHTTLKSYRSQWSKSTQTKGRSKVRAS